MFNSYEQVKAFFDSRKKFGIKPGLERINRLLQLLDNPQDKIKAIHVAGTNGKGSTIAFLNHALIKNGYRVGVFTSPSLEGLTGHIFCNDEKIGEDVFLSLLNEIYPVLRKLDATENHPTEFEIITVLAFLYFKKHVDIALIETGMGGRYDTTNCCQPIVSIITNIDRDHTVFLGTTIKEIAAHKAGIIKENIPVITGASKDEAITRIKYEAKDKNSNVYRLSKDFTYTYLPQPVHRQIFTWSDSSNLQFEVPIQMHGEHQVKNCSLALMALVLLKENGLSINWQKSIEGIANTRVPGRFEVIKKVPTIILDGAHNLVGVQSLLQTIKANYRNEEKHLLFAAFKDKELQKMLDLLAPNFLTVTVTSFDHPRAVSAKTLYDFINYQQKYIEKDWRAVLNKICNPSKKGHPHYFITGSLYFIAEVRSFLEKNK